MSLPPQLPLKPPLLPPKPLMFLSQLPQFKLPLKCPEVLPLKPSQFKLPKCPQLPLRLLPMSPPLNL